MPTTPAGLDLAIPGAATTWSSHTRVLLATFSVKCLHSIMLALMILRVDESPYTAAAKDCLHEHRGRLAHEHAMHAHLPGSSAIRNNGQLQHDLPVHRQLSITAAG
jgi:hypothetical protein